MYTEGMGGSAEAEGIESARPACNATGGSLDRHRDPHNHTGMGHPTPDFDQMEASLLYCPKCRQATPVRKRLLLVLSEGEKFDYVCAQCGTISGDKIERPPPRQW